MSKRHERSGKEPQPDSMPGLDYHYSDQYRYAIYAGHVILAFAAFGRWHSGFTLPLDLAIDMHQKLGATLAETIRPQAGQPAGPPVEEPKNDQ